MNDQTPIRETLLGLEPLNPEMHQRFERQIQDIYEEKLTKGMRLYWYTFLVGSVVQVLGSSCVLLSAPRGWTLWGSLLAIVVSLAVGTFASRILKRGRVDSRVQFRAGKFMPAGAMLIVMASFVYGVYHLQKPEAVFCGIYALALFVLVSSINLWNRIVAADYHAQEHALRLEYRLAELAGRLPGTGPSTGPAGTEHAG